MNDLERCQKLCQPSWANEAYLFIWECKAFSKGWVATAFALALLFAFGLAVGLAAANAGAAIPWRPSTGAPGARAAGVGTSAAAWPEPKPKGTLNGALLFGSWPVLKHQHKILKDKCESSGSSISKQVCAFSLTVFKAATPSDWTRTAACLQ